MTNEKAPIKARKLNMDEKRKLEKLLLADIESALTAYDIKRKNDRAKAEANCVNNASREIRGLFEQYQAARKTQSRIANDLERAGFRINGYRDNHNLEVASGYGAIKPKPIRDFDAETARTSKAFAELKRSYILKLFAGGQEAQELFASLAHELSAIVKQS